MVDGATTSVAEKLVQLFAVIQLAAPTVSGV